MFLDYNRWQIHPLSEVILWPVSGWSSQQKARLGGSSWTCDCAELDVDCEYATHDCQRRLCNHGAGVPKVLSRITHISARCGKRDLLC